MADLKEPINKFFYGYLINTPDAEAILTASLDNAEHHLLFCVRQAFHAGARYDFRTCAELSPHIARFLEMCVLLGPDPERDDWMRDLPLPNDTVYDDEVRTDVPF